MPEPIRLTDEQLTGWATDTGEPFPPYWEDENWDYTQAMAAELLELRQRNADALAAIQAVQAAHESQLTRMAKVRARGERKTERLKARVADLEAERDELPEYRCPCECGDYVAPRPVVTVHLPEGPS
ncbi:hypothetical protein [Nocardia sp. NPDC051463]|uniref:hypothetical protein n=1 Tax=Nocardia sp. NPDC051463 TaxID=3154845 RepID=UPI00344FA0BA